MHKAAYRKGEERGEEDINKNNIASNIFVYISTLLSLYGYHFLICKTKTLML